MVDKIRVPAGVKAVMSEDNNVWQNNDVLLTVNNCVVGILYRLGMILWNIAN